MWKVVLVIFIVSLVFGSVPLFAETLTEVVEPYILVYGEPDHIVVAYCRACGWRIREYIWDRRVKVYFLYNRKLHKGWKVILVRPFFNV